MGYPDASMAQGGGPAGQDLDPLEMVWSAADLVNPVVAARQLPWLLGELLMMPLGRSGLAPEESDPRFADAAWRENFFFRQLGSGYRLFEEWASRMAGATEGPWDRQARTRYLASIVTAAASPTNFLLTNPAALKRAFETGGGSVLRGARNMTRDLAAGGMPQMVDRGAFGVGEKLACTPGAVVYRDEIFELLQYTPATPAVRARPLLMVPPELNRYYVLDLAPGRSLVEYCVASGIQTFMIVWRNPRPELGHGRWGIDDYLAAQATAAGVVQKITGSDKVNWLGLCAGGITTALMLGYLAATGDASAGSATFIVTMLTNRCPNIIGMMDTGASRATLRRAAGPARSSPARACAPASPGCAPTTWCSATWSAAGCSGRTRPPSTCWPGTTMPPRSARGSRWKAPSCWWTPWRASSRSPCSAPPSTWRRWRPTASTSPATPTTSRRGGPPTPRPRCWAATSRWPWSSPATSSRSSTRPPKPAMTTGRARRPPPTRTSGWPGRPSTTGRGGRSGSGG